MIDQKSIGNFKKLIADYRALTAKVQKDNQNKTKSLKETNLVLKRVKKSIKSCILSTKI